MSGNDSYPPPGAPGPADRGASQGWAPPPPPGWGAAPQGWAAPAPGWPQLPAAHKPGVIPLKPLSLGDLYNGAFKMIRVNPGATVGSAVLVSVAAMAIPLVLAVAVSSFFDLGELTGGDYTETEVLGQFGSMAATVLGSLLQWFGLIFVTGMIAHVAMVAAVGRKISLTGAWALTRGRRWRLAGLSVLLFLSYLLFMTVYALAWVVVVLTAEVALIVIWGVVSVPAFLCLMFWAWIRIFYFPVPPLMVEGVGVFEAIGRGYELSSRQFWRTFGIALLTWLITGMASSILSMPVALVAAIAPLLVAGNAGIFLGLLLQSIGTILATAFVAPFSAGVVSLQYVDQRIRKEAYDVELLAEAGRPAA